MLPLRRFLFVLLVSLAATLAARAQSVRWEPAGGTLARDQVSALNLVFQDCEPKSDPALPVIPGLTVEPRPNRSEQSTFNVTFGSQAVRQRTITYSYRVRPARPDGEVRIPAFTVETDAGSLTVSPAGFTVAAASVGQSGLPLDKIVTARFNPPVGTIWAGEVFRLTHLLEVERRYATNSILGGPLDWTPSPLIAEEWSKPTGTEAQVNGQARLLVTTETRAIAPTATGDLALPTATQIVNLPTGQANAFSVFGQSAFEQFTITTAPATLQVRPLPSPAPADFKGAVGQFTLTGKVVPQKAAVGEPITWTLTLAGTGNWPVIDRLPPRTLSRDFRVVTPRAQKTPAENSLFDATLSEDLVLIPQKPGRTTLGPYTISVFNPRTGAYETLRTEPVTVEVVAATTSTEIPNTKSQIPNTSSTTDSADPAVADSDTPPEPAVPVAKLPAAPIPSASLSAAPLANWPRLLLWTLPALAFPLVLWLTLADRHARAHDPLRARREAHARLREILVRIETATTVNPDDLLAWQNEVRTLFGIASATPSARDLSDPVWAALWTDTETALYRFRFPLSEEWNKLAREALARATPPSRSVLSALRPVHLFPRVLLWAVVLHSALVLAPFASAATDATTTPDPAASYASGDFRAAESAWRKAAQEQPLSPAHHHNLALALAQQGKWDESAAHAYVAHVQAPAAPEARRLLDVVLPKASYRLNLPSTGVALLSPRAWQLVALAAALVLLILPPSLYLASRYLPRPRARRPFVLGHCALVISLAVLAAATLALRAYGPAASAETVLVWRDSTLRAVPTDVGDQKVTADLPAGTLARIDKSFLGWRRLVLADGNIGWVRVESLAGLWRTP